MQDKKLQSRAYQTENPSNRKRTSPRPDRQSNDLKIVQIGTYKISPIGSKGDSLDVTSKESEALVQQVTSNFGGLAEHAPEAQPEIELDRAAVKETLSHDGETKMMNITFLQN